MKKILFFLALGLLLNSASIFAIGDSDDESTDDVEVELPTRIRFSPQASKSIFGSDTSWIFVKLKETQFIVVPQDDSDKEARDLLEIVLGGAEVHRLFNEARNAGWTIKSPEELEGFLQQEFEKKLNADEKFKSGRARGYSDALAERGIFERNSKKWIVGTALAVGGFAYWMGSRQQ